MIERKKEPHMPAVRESYPAAPTHAALPLLFINDTDVLGSDPRSLVRDSEYLCRLVRLQALRLYYNAHSVVADYRNALLKALCLNESFNVVLVLNINGNL